MKPYIQVHLMNFGHPTRGWAKPVDSEETVTLSLSNIVSVHDEYSGERSRGKSFLCVVSMINGKSFKVTYETGREVLKTWKQFLNQNGENND